MTELEKPLTPLPHTTVAPQELPAKKTKTETESESEPELSAYHKLVKNLTKDEILAKFPDVIPLEQTTGKSSSAGSLLEGGDKSNIDQEDKFFAGQDEEQIKLMAENCIVLDYNDKPIGSGTKKLCHIKKNIDEGLLHRAFSVFLFNSKNELLLQQRATEKITFADQWTNTCCSHPLCVPSELGSVDGELEASIKGAQVAAQRKLDHELGIAAKYVPVDNFKFLTRIHYAAPSNGLWAEHEIDYIFIIKSDPVVDANWNEVRDFKYVTKEKLKEMFEDENLVFTPWFKLICESYLFKWWDQIDNLEKYKSTEINHML
ncbi:unnamed protein product [Ambrosiozyma monospora]|uniref:Isopentenyl-diphosphate Delta-isomerase n=1 Tax=Ambrosiozyma monospora TaxID=43982 RepID=A0A9W6YS37_AMBMO|nr:unnamed protein product [Ambrosiozyma monospora]